MSRLADALMAMDRRAPRSEGIGGIPELTATPRPRPWWRRAVLLVIVVVAMVGISVTALVVRPRSVVLTPPPRPAPIVAPLATPSTPLPAIADQGFVALVSQGLTAAQGGDLEEAAGLMKKALELRPTDADSWNSLGVILVRQGDMSRGVGAFRQALSLDPNHPEAHRNLAVALDRQGRSDEAATHYRAFLRLGAEGHPGGDAVHRRLAEIAAPRSAR